MKIFFCSGCESRLLDTETISIFNVKCGHCKMMNQFRQGTNYPDDRYMSELDWERAEKKRIKRKEKRLTYANS